MHFLSFVYFLNAFRQTTDMPFCIKSNNVTLKPLENTMKEGVMTSEHVFSLHLTGFGAKQLNEQSRTNEAENYITSNKTN